MESENQKTPVQPWISTQRVRLEDSSPVGITNVAGKSMPGLIMGIVLALLGILFFLQGMGVIQADSGAQNDPLWISFILPGIFFLLGGLTTWTALKSILKAKRVEQEKRKYPDQPWLWDYSWEPMGINAGRGKDATRQLVGVFVMGLFLIPFNWWAFGSDNSSFLIVIIVSILDVAVLAGLGYGIYMLMQALKYGESRLGFTDFPFFLGGSMNLMLMNLPTGIQSLELNLRHIEEFWTSPSNSEKNPSQLCDELYRETRKLESYQITRGHFPMKWDLPEEKDLTSHLSEDPLRYWQLEVKAETQGINYHCRFLLPVYAKP